MKSIWSIVFSKDLQRRPPVLEDSKFRGLLRLLLRGYTYITTVVPKITNKNSMSIKQKLYLISHDKIPLTFKYQQLKMKRNPDL